MADFNCEYSVLLLSFAVMHFILGCTNLSNGFIYNAHFFSSYNGLLLFCEVLTIF